MVHRPADPRRFKRQFQGSVHLFLGSDVSLEPDRSVLVQDGDAVVAESPALLERKGDPFGGLLVPGGRLRGEHSGHCGQQDSRQAATHACPPWIARSQSIGTSDSTATRAAFRLARPSGRGVNGHSDFAPYLPPEKRFSAVKEGKLEEFF